VRTLRVRSVMLLHKRTCIRPRLKPHISAHLRTNGVMLPRRQKSDSVAGHLALEWPLTSFAVGSECGLATIHRCAPLQIA